MINPYFFNFDNIGISILTRMWFTFLTITLFLVNYVKRNFYIFEFAFLQRMMELY